MTITTRTDLPPPSRIRRMGPYAFDRLLGNIASDLESQIPGRCEPAMRVRLTRRMRLGQHRYDSPGLRIWFAPVVEVLARAGVTHPDCVVEYAEARSALGGFEVAIEGEERHV